MTTYGYDDADRLTSQGSPIAAYQFTLDGNGNRTQIVQDEPYTPVMTLGAVSYTYNTQKNRLVSAGANMFLGTDQPIINQQETFFQPVKFVGQHGVMTEPNEFYYMRARYYDLWVGRSVSEDHIGLEGHFSCHETNNCFCKTNKKELLSIGRKR